MPGPVTAPPERLVTAPSLEAELRSLGVRAGSTVLIHSSLSRVGWVCGGAVAVLQALLAALGPTGTVVVPTHTAELSDPSTWRNPPVPEQWWPAIRETMPAYDPARTPSLAMGALAEQVRTWPGALRSAHPQVSFAAVGPAAEQVTADHALANGLGETSPLARLYDLDAWVLLIGVGHERNTSLHLAEYRAGVRSPVQQSAPVLLHGAARWVTWPDIDVDSDDFPALGEDLARAGLVRTGPLGGALGHLMHQPSVIDFAGRWLLEHTAPQMQTSAVLPASTPRTRGRPETTSSAGS